MCLLCSGLAIRFRETEIIASFGFVRFMRNRARGDGAALYIDVADGLVRFLIVLSNL